MKESSGIDSLEFPRGLPPLILNRKFILNKSIADYVVSTFNSRMHIFFLYDRIRQKIVSRIGCRTVCAQGMLCSIKCTALTERFIHLRSDQLGTCNI